MTDNDNDNENANDNNNTAHADNTKQYDTIHATGDQWRVEGWTSGNRLARTLDTCG